jgi:hypothetical protein
MIAVLRPSVWISLGRCLRNLHAPPSGVTGSVCIKGEQ